MQIIYKKVTYIRLAFRNPCNKVNVNKCCVSLEFIPVFWLRKHVLLSGLIVQSLMLYTVYVVIITYTAKMPEVNCLPPPPLFFDRLCS